MNELRAFIFITIASCLNGCSVWEDFRSEQRAAMRRADVLATIDYTQCEANGGTIKSVCMFGTPACVMPYPDAGRECTDSSECGGMCEVALEGGDPNPQVGAETAGICSTNDDPCGCWFEVLDSKVQRSAS